MFRPTARSRFALLAACVAFVACASAPEPKKTSKRKKRKKDRIELKEKKKADKGDDEAVKITDEGDDEGNETKKRKDTKKDDESSDVASDSKRKAKDDEETKKAKDEEQRDEVASKAKKKKAKGDEETDEVDSKPKKKAKDEEESDEVVSKPKKKAKDEEESDEVVTKAKKKKGDEETDEVATKAKKKKARDEEAEPERVASKSKRKAKSEEPVVDESDVEIDDAEPAAAKPSKTKKAKGRDKKTEEVADEGPIIEMEGDEEPVEKRAAAIPVPGVEEDDPIGDTSTSVTATATPEAGPSTGPLNERSLTLGNGKLGVHGGLRVAVLTLPGATPPMTVSTTSEALALGVTYGVGEKAELGVDYTLSINPGRLKGPFMAHGAYLVTHSAKLDVAVAGAFAVDFDVYTDPTTMMTSSKTYVGLQLGAWARYRVAPKVSLFTGLPALPSSNASLTKLAFPLPPFGYQLALGLNDGASKALEVPVGLGFQASPQIYAFTTFNLAHIRISNTENVFLFKDAIQFALGGFYSLDKIDIGAVFADDLKQGTDYLRFDVVARYFVK